MWQLSVAAVERPYDRIWARLPTGSFCVAEPSDSYQAARWDRKPETGKTGGFATVGFTLRRSFIPKKRATVRAFG